jgi:hypothetical protein
MDEYILSAIEQVERNTAKARERLERARLAAAARPPDEGEAAAHIAAAMEEIERIERLAAGARADYAATNSGPETNKGEETTWAR